MISYKILATGIPNVFSILRSDGCSIPPDPANSDYAEYLAWVAEGNTATEWQPEA